MGSAYGAGERGTWAMALRAATLNHAPPIPRSICIGISRLSILESSSGESIMFETASVPPRLLSNGLLSAKLRSLCLMPIINASYPTSVKKGFRCASYEYFRRFVTARKEIDTIMWVIGNSVLDPVSTARCVFLTGEGVTGKPSLCNYVYECLGKCAFIVDAAVLYGNHGLSWSVASQCVSHWMMISPDVDFEQNRMNVQNFKTLLGHDYIKTEIGSAKTTASMLLGCNTLPDPKETAQWEIL